MRFLHLMNHGIPTGQMCMVIQHRDPAGALSAVMVFRNQAKRAMTGRPTAPRHAAVSQAVRTHQRAHPVMMVSTATAQRPVTAREAVLPAYR